MSFQRHQSAVLLGSVLTVAAFVATTAYMQYRLTTLDDLSAALATNATPSLEYLGRGGMRLERIRSLLYDGLLPGRAAALSQAQTELRALSRDIERYLQLTPLPGEHTLWTEMRTNVDRAAAVAGSVIAAGQRGDAAEGTRLLEARADPAFDRAGQTIMATLEFDVRSSEQLARDVGTVRSSTTARIVVLNVMATCVALVTSLVAFRASRDHDRLLQDHNALLKQRVADLDGFAGRVAHDILSPLDRVAIGLALMARSADAQVRSHIDRTQRALQRVKQLVEGLLAFARAGAPADAGSRCAVDVVLANIAADSADTAREMGIELVVEPCPPAEVATSVGVLTSIVQNLVSNALKYMGDRPTRRVIVRTSAEGGRVRIEIADTGPGIPASLQASMFQPFVRGDHDAVAGLGLGLSTVRRLVEAHGGSITVESMLGVGTVFSVEFEGRATATASKPAEALAEHPPVHHT